MLPRLFERKEKNGNPVLKIPEYSPETSSPSGRWVVLGGDVSEGDYIHRNLVLLDRAKGDIYPLGPRLAGAAATGRETHAAPAQDSYRKYRRGGGRD